MTFFVFGPSYESWAIGNKFWGSRRNLVSPLKELLDQTSSDGYTEIDGYNILWLSTGPNGLCYVKVLNQPNNIYSDTTFYRSTNPTLLADTNVQSDWNARSVEHIAFTNDGGWIVCYSDGQVRVSLHGTFPESFHTEMSSEIQTRGYGGLQSSTLQYVWFGADDTMILQFRTGKIRMRGFLASHPLVARITEYFNRGLMLTRTTSLCRWDSSYYFAEFAPVSWEAKTEYGFTARLYSWSIHPNGYLSDILIREVIEENGFPVSYTAIEPVDYPPPGQSTQTASQPTLEPVTKPTPAHQESGVRAMVLWDYEAAEDNEISLKELEYIDHISFVDDDWWLGENDRGESGLFPSNYVKLEKNEKTTSGAQSKGKVNEQKKLVPKSVKTKQENPPIVKTAEIVPPTSTQNEPKKNNPFAKKVEPPNDELSAETKSFFTSVFHTSEPHEGADYITGEKAVKILRHYGEGLGDEELGEIWDRCDDNEDGRLDLTEFLNIMKMIQKRAQSKKLAASILKRNSSATQSQTNAEEGSDPPPPPYTPSTSVQKMEPTSSRTITETLICSLCCKNITDKAFSCSVCESGEFDMCAQCQKSGHRCPGRHTLECVEIITTRELSLGLEKMDLNRANMNSNNPNGTRSEDDRHLRDTLLSAIVTEKPNVKWDDVAGLEAAKEDIQEAIVLPLRFPDLFTGGRKARRGMLLYGPPGTGKSFLAKAIATEIESTLFSISASELLSKYIGESERLIKQLFTLAREKKPSIIFIDEIDSLCGSRDSADANPHLVGVKTEILVQMDGVGRDNEGVLVLGATNIPWSLDSAIRRRFQRLIHIPLPDEGARRQLFKISAQKENIELSKSDYVELGKKTAGWSGSDIANAMQDAYMGPVKRAKMAKHFKKVVIDGKDFYTPCNENDNGSITMSWKDIPKNRLKESKCVAEDIFKALAKVKPSVSQEDIDKAKEWTEMFGMEGV